MNLKRI